MKEINRNEKVTIGTTSGEISAEKSRSNRNERQSIIIINTSLLGEKISIAIDSAAILGNGIVLSPGGVWSDTSDGAYKPTQKRIQAIADAATATISIQERIWSF